MKKVIMIAICICLVFSSVIPSYAATQNTNILYFSDGLNVQNQVSAYDVMTGIRSGINNLYNELHNWIGSTGSNAINMTWKQFAYYIDQFLTDGDGVIGIPWEDVARELTVDGQVNPTNMTIKEILYVVSNFIVETFSGGGDMWNMTADISSNTQTTNSLLTNLNNYNFQKYPAFNYYLYNREFRTQHWQIDEQGNFGDYTEEYLQYNSSQHTSVLDYIVAFLSDINYNQAIQYNQLMTDVDATLSIWDSQGDSITQSTWTPSSAMNGLYKYLAFTQRDVARLTHVLASDYEIEARDNVQDLQESFNDQFLDPDSDGAISTDDIEGISGLSGGIKENISTNANASGIFDIFNTDHGGWFSQETANELDTSTSQNRGNRNVNSTYPTPLLDERINEIYNALGVNDND